MNQKKIVIAIFGLIMLAGCAGEINPAKASLFDNLKNISSGEYDRQISEQNEEVEKIIASNKAARKNISSLETQTIQE
jgi:hypothetical protein